MWGHHPTLFLYLSVTHIRDFLSHKIRQTLPAVGLMAGYQQVDQAQVMWRAQWRSTAGGHAVHSHGRLFVRTAILMQPSKNLVVVVNDASNAHLEDVRPQQSPSSQSLQTGTCSLPKQRLKNKHSPCPGFRIFTKSISHLAARWFHHRLISC